MTTVEFEVKPKLKIYHSLVLACNTPNHLLWYIISPTDLFLIDAVISLDGDGSYTALLLQLYWTQQILSAGSIWTVLFAVLLVSFTGMFIFTDQHKHASGEF